MLIQSLVFIPKLIEFGTNDKLAINYLNYDIKQLHTTQFQSLLPKDHHVKHKITIGIN